MTPVPEFDRVSDTIVTWQAWQAEVKCDCGSTAILGQDGWSVFDPVPLAPDAWAALLGEAPVAGILLTSGNHQRASLELRRRFGVPIHAPEAARTDLDADYWHGNCARVGAFSMVTLPGGGPGESAWCDGETLVLGDALINLDQLAMLPNRYCSDPRELARSLKKLSELNFQRAAFAHGHPLVHDTARVLRDFVSAL